MAEVPAATAAPAAETVVAGDAPTQSGPTVGEHCVTDRPTPSGQASTGEVRKLGDVDVYISKPSDYPHAPARLLLLLTGGTGLKSTNNQIQADKFASEGFLVVMPDLFEGDAAPNSTAIPEEEATGSILDTFKIKAVETAKSFMIDMWLARHTEEKVLPLLHKVLDACKQEFADAVSNGGGIYAVGYCFGGRYVLLLASDKAPAQGGWGQKPADEESGTVRKGPFIKAGALAHGTLVSREDFEGVKVPVSLVCVENDPMFANEARIAGEDYLAKNNVEHEVQVYPDMPHGFAVVGDYNDDKIKAAQVTAFEQMLKWIKEH